MTESEPTTSKDQRLPDPRAIELLRRAEQVTFEVATLAPSDRNAAIRRLCADDPTLEAEVRSLLATAAKMGAFLDRPALGASVYQLAQAADDDAADELIGASLGPFRIERKIASGGMGAVYLGHRNDGQFELQVAIKVVKRGMDSDEILRRFRAERQTLAALDHPNIARLIDGGVSPDGRPFLVMEFVEGLPIDKYCDEHRLTIAHRIELFRQVCDAVHHAHQNLVIHRDLKPSNILVTPAGVAKLLDFGIAKVLSADLPERHITTATDRRLTPDYASPEQIDGGPVTTASDVYSLGVVLYELLAGARPYYFSAKTSEEMHRVVCELMPSAPSNAVSARAGRSRRTSRSTAIDSASHSTPDASAGDSESGAGADIPKTRGMSSTRLRSVLRGDLDNIVLRALRKEPQRRYASAEQFSADLKRYLDGLPVQARRDTISYRASKFVRRHSVGVALSSAAVALLALSTVVLYRQSVRLERQRDSLVATNRSLEATRRYLVTVLGGGDTGNLGPDARLGDLLTQASQALLDTPPEDPMSRAAAELALGRAVMSLGMLAEARPLLENAGRAYAVLELDSDPRMDAQLSLGELLFFERRYAEAETAFRELLDRERARTGGAPSERAGLILNNLGASVRLQNRADEALQIQREALAVRQAVLKPHALDIAESHNNIGTALFQSGDHAGAVKQFEDALQIRSKQLRADHPLVIRCRSNLGLAQLRTGNVDAAIENLTLSVDAWGQSFGAAHPGIVATRIALSQALRERQRFDEAIAQVEAALAWQRERLAAEDDRILSTEAQLALALADAGRETEALRILERVTPLLLKVGGNSQTLANRAQEMLQYLRGRVSPETGAPRDQ